MKHKEFEQGSIVCQECGHKPEDSYDPNPSDFTLDGGDWYCLDCSEDLTPNMADAIDLKAWRLKELRKRMK